MHALLVLLSWLICSTPTQASNSSRQERSMFVSNLYPTFDYFLTNVESHERLFASNNDDVDNVYTYMWPNGVPPKSGLFHYELVNKDIPDLYYFYENDSERRLVMTIKYERSFEKYVVGLAIHGRAYNLADQWRVRSSRGVYYVLNMEYYRYMSSGALENLSAGSIKDSMSRYVLGVRADESPRGTTGLTQWHITQKGYDPPT